MGSGLILLVIVGAWLAVLVPMALRSHDASSLGTVDKFHDAMRVLSRRGAPGRAEQDEDGEPGTASSVRRSSGEEPPTSVRVTARGASASDPVSVAVAADPDRRPDRRPVRTVRAETDQPVTEAAQARAAAAARRTRLLVGLVLLAVGTAVGAAVGPLWLLAPHVVVDLLLIALVLLLRRQAVARAEREWRRAMAVGPADARTGAARTGAAGAGAARAGAAGSGAVRTGAVRTVAPAVRHAVHVVGVPDRMPSRPLPLGAPLPAPAARYEDPATRRPARGAQGGAWSPVPVPTPTYLSAPTAPRRVVDLTRPGAYADGLAAAEREVGIVDDGPQLDDILDRRRAVNDW